MDNLRNVDFVSWKVTPLRQNSIMPAWQEKLSFNADLVNVMTSCKDADATLVKVKVPITVASYFSSQKVDEKTMYMINLYFNFNSC